MIAEIVTSRSAGMGCVDSVEPQLCDLRLTAMRLRHLAPAVVLLAVACNGGAAHATTSGFRLVNDTGTTVVVHGCEAGCEGASVKPGGHLDFQEPRLRLRLTGANGSTTCWMIARGILPPTPPPRETLAVSGASKAAC